MYGSCLYYEPQRSLTCLPSVRRPCERKLASAGHPAALWREAWQKGAAFCSVLVGFFQGVGDWWGCWKHGISPQHDLAYRYPAVKDAVRPTRAKRLDCRKRAVYLCRFCRLSDSNSETRSGIPQEGFVLRRVDKATGSQFHPASQRLPFRSDGCGKCRCVPVGLEAAGALSPLARSPQAIAGKGVTGEAGVGWKNLRVFRFFDPSQTV